LAGFTLLELLIVVIIVSLLAAVALPLFTKMTSRARSAEASTAVGAILTAEALYYQEHNVFTGSGGYPWAGLPVDVSTTHFTYALSTNGSTSATVTGTGQGAGYSGIIVTGTIWNDSSKALAVTIGGGPPVGLALNPPPSAPPSSPAAPVPGPRGRASGRIQRQS